MIKKIKDKIKKSASKKMVTRKRTVKAGVRLEPSQEARKEFHGFQEMVVEKAKFSHPEITRAHGRRSMPQELPGGYDQDKIALMVRDPWWLHTYWEVRWATFERYKSELGDNFYKARRVLRVYDVSNIIFNGSNAHQYFDIHVNEYSSNWYIDAGGPGKSWCVDYGLLLPDGRFVTIVRSNVVHTPIVGPSWITDEEWMIPEEMFARLYGMGFGLGQSSPVGKAWQERIKQALFSGAMASPGMASMASPVKKEVRERKFWMWVDCELIVYGATEPDAKVTVQGRSINLRQEGTFTLRFALPDGKQAIPVKAVSADEIEERTVTPIVSRETKTSNLIKEVK